MSFRNSRKARPGIWKIEALVITILCRNSGIARCAHAPERRIQHRHSEMVPQGPDPESRCPSKQSRVERSRANPQSRRLSFRGVSAASEPGISSLSCYPVMSSYRSAHSGIAMFNQLVFPGPPPLFQFFLTCDSRRGIVICFEREQSCNIVA